MKAAAPPQRRRRRSTLRRLFFWAAAPGLALGAAAPRSAPTLGGPRDQNEARLLSRQVRIARDADGALRVVELLHLRLGAQGAPATEAPLPLVRLTEGAIDVRGLGGDVSPDRLVYDPPHVALLGPAPDSVLGIAFAYRLAPAATTIELAADLPVDEPDVRVAQGNVEARPGPRLARAGTVGPEEQPYARYLARDLAAGDAAVLRVVRHRVETRHRLAVLLATALAAGVAGAYALRRARAVGP